MNVLAPRSSARSDERSGGGGGSWPRLSSASASSAWPRPRGLARPLSRRSASLRASTLPTRGKQLPRSPPTAALCDSRSWRWGELNPRVGERVTPSVSRRSSAHVSTARSSGTERARCELACDPRRPPRAEGTSSPVGWHPIPRTRRQGSGWALALSERRSECRRAERIANRVLHPRECADTSACARRIYEVPSALGL